MHVAAIACQVVQSEPGWNLWGLRISRGHVHACLQVCWALLLKGGKTAKSICDGVIPPEGKSKANILMRCGAFVILSCCKVGWAPHRSGAWVLCLCSSKVGKELPRQAADAGHRGALLCWHTLQYGLLLLLWGQGLGTPSDFFWAKMVWCNSVFEDSPWEKELIFKKQL